MSVDDPPLSTNLEIVRRLLAAIADDLIVDRLTFIERTKASTFDGGDMDEHVLAACLGLNESITLRRVEPFDSASRHHRLLEMHEPDRDRTTMVRSLIRQLSWGSPHGDAATNNASSNSQIILGWYDAFNQVRNGRHK